MSQSGLSGKASPHKFFHFSGFVVFIQCLVKVVVYLKCAKNKLKNFSLQSILCSKMHFSFFVCKLKILL